MSLKTGDRVKIATFCGTTGDIKAIAGYYGRVAKYWCQNALDPAYAEVEIDGHVISVRKNSLVLQQDTVVSIPKPKFDLHLISQFSNLYCTLSREEKELSIRFMDLVRSKVE